MYVHGYPWISLRTYVLKSMDGCRHPWISRDMHGHPWIMPTTLVAGNLVFVKTTRIRTAAGLIFTLPLEKSLFPILRNIERSGTLHKVESAPQCSPWEQPWHLLEHWGARFTLWPSVFTWFPGITFFTVLCYPEGVFPQQKKNEVLDTLGASKCPIWN